MKRLVVLAAATLLGAVGATASPISAAASTAPPVVRVMPLGDSITYGVGSPSGVGYRLPLWNLAAAQSRYTVDFVGSQRNGLGAMLDPDNEGHSGFKIDEIRSGIDGWLSAARPDVVLLHIGINDLASNTDTAHAADRLTALVDQIFADKPGITVVMQGLVPTTPGLQDLVQQYNDQVRRLAPIEQQTGKHFTFVDAPALISTQMADASHPAEMFDNLHPNDLGYQRIAQNFWAPLDQAFTNGWVVGGPPLPVLAAPSHSSSTVVDLNGTVWVFRIGTDHHLYEAHLPKGGAWAGWNDLGGTVLVNNPSATVAHDGTLLVVAHGNDGHLYEQHLPQVGSWSGWNDLGGGALTDSPATVTDANGLLRVYSRGTDGHLYEKFNYPGQPWSGFRDMGGGIITNSPSATIGKDGTVLVVVHGTDRHLYEADLQPGHSWYGWNDLGGGILDGSPAAVTDTNGAMRVYSRGTDSHVYEKSVIPGQSWSGFMNMGGGNLASSPATTIGQDGTVLVVDNGSDGNLYEADLQPGHAWFGWTNLGGAIVDGSPTATTDLTGALRVYVHGTDNHVYEKSVVPGQPWSGFMNMGGGNLT